MAGSPTPRAARTSAPPVPSPTADPSSTSGSSAAFTWRNTAMHRTLNWQYYVDGNLHQTFNGNAAQPPQTVTHQVTGLPGGRHKILAVWNIYDTPMAFYACVDVNVGGGGGGGTPPPPP